MSTFPFVFSTTATLPAPWSLLRGAVSWLSLITTGTPWRPSPSTRARSGGPCIIWRLTSCLICTGTKCSSKSYCELLDLIDIKKCIVDKLQVCIIYLKVTLYKVVLGMKISTIFQNKAMWQSLISCIVTNLSWILAFCVTGTLYQCAILIFYVKGAL